MSLFLFGDVHKDLWKTEQGTVIGLLNANPMKPKEGLTEVRLEGLDYLAVVSAVTSLSETSVLIFQGSA